MGFVIQVKIQFISESLTIYLRFPFDKMHFPIIELNICLIFVQYIYNLNHNFISSLDNEFHIMVKFIDVLQAYHEEFVTIVLTNFVASVGNIPSKTK